jgi:ABC-type proline/glycine betaine transport system ATPase subunit
LFSFFQEKVQSLYEKPIDETKPVDEHARKFSANYKRAKVFKPTKFVNELENPEEDAEQTAGKEETVDITEEENETDVTMIEPTTEKEDENPAVVEEDAEQIAGKGETVDLTEEENETDAPMIEPTTDLKETEVVAAEATEKEDENPAVVEETVAEPTVAEEAEKEGQDSDVPMEG